MGGWGGGGGEVGWGEAVGEGFRALVLRIENGQAEHSGGVGGKSF